MKDIAESYRIEKPIWDLPMRLLVIGKSQLSGKSNLLGNLLLRPYDASDHQGQQYYKGLWDKDSIFIVCPSIDFDDKWKSIIRGLEIPAKNIIDEYDEEKITEQYSIWEKEFLEAVESGEKPSQRLFLFDDCSYGGSLKSKKNGIIARLFQNGRHLLFSTILTAQKYSDVLTAARENMTGGVFYACSHKQAELIFEDISPVPKAQFVKTFNAVCSEPYSFMALSYNRKPEERFMDRDFDNFEWLS